MPRFDESDPKIVKILPPEREHDHLEEFSEMFQKWKDRMDAGGERFGIMLINEPHEHDEDEGRNEEEENAMTALITKFRRENREQTNRSTIGYASVYNGKMTDEQFEKASERTAQFASYMFGIRGRMFKEPVAAAVWLHEIAEFEPLPLVGKGEAAGPDGSTSAAIFYGSTTGSTELIAEKVQSAWAGANGETLPIVNVGDQSQIMSLLQYNKLLLGIPTWNIGKLQDDWEIVFPYLERIDLSDKTIAIFGVGDQYGYPENFQDAMGILGFKLIERGAKLVGYTSVDGYEHDYSRAIDGDQFIGLAIDDVNQPELTNGRIEAWVGQVISEFNEDQVLDF